MVNCVICDRAIEDECVSFREEQVFTVRQPCTCGATNFMFCSKWSVNLRPNFENMYKINDALERDLVVKNICKNKVIKNDIVDTYTPKYVFCHKQCLQNSNYSYGKRLIFVKYLSPVKCEYTFNLNGERLMETFEINATSDVMYLENNYVSASKANKIDKEENHKSVYGSVSKLSTEI